MPKCDFNKVAKQLYRNYTSAWVYSCKFAAYFQNMISYEHLWAAASELWTSHHFPVCQKILFNEAVNWPNNLFWRSLRNIYNFSKLDSTTHSLLLLLFLCPLVFLLLQPVCHMSVICLFLSVTSMPLFCSCLSLVFCQLFICY